MTAVYGLKSAADIFRLVGGIVQDKAKVNAPIGTYVERLYFRAGKDAENRRDEIRHGVVNDEKLHDGGDGSEKGNAYGEESVDDFIISLPKDGDDRAENDPEEYADESHEKRIRNGARDKEESGREYFKVDHDGLLAPLWECSLKK